MRTKAQKQKQKIIEMFHEQVGARGLGTQNARGKVVYWQGKAYEAVERRS
jgi:hypothetical protein